MKKAQPVAVYWDSSSVLSALFKDTHSEEALSMSRKDGIHLLSTLCYAEVCAVISRISREKLLSDVLTDVALETLEIGPWSHLNIWPEWDKLKVLSSKWSLRGANLWHLGSALTLKKQLPELTLLTFDSKLRAASEGEHI